MSTVRAKPLTITLVLVLFISVNITTEAHPVLAEVLTLTVGPQDGDTQDAHINPPRGENFAIEVDFGPEAESGNRQVWPTVHYETLTKTILETPQRFIDQQHVEFSFGWRNVAYSESYVRAFFIRIFYIGTQAVQVNVTVHTPGATTNVTFTPLEQTMIIIGVTATICVVVVLLVAIRRRR